MTVKELIKRKYKCIGLHESTILHWSSYLKIGSIYEGKQTETEGELYLLINTDHFLYVEKDQFELIT